MFFVPQKELGTNMENGNSSPEKQLREYDSSFFWAWSDMYEVLVSNFQGV